MPGENPQHKGTGLIPLVAGLKALPGVRDELPPHLHRYLDEPVLPSGWYPERDYVELLETFAARTDAATTGGNVWAFIGRAAAQWDLAGDRESVAPPSRTGSSGLYRQFVKADPTDAPSFFLRAKKLWQLYRDTGALEVFRRGEGPVVVLRLSGYQFPFRGLVEVQTAYFLEFARLSGLKMDGRAVPPSKNDATDWEFTLEDPSPRVLDWVANLVEA
jgi:hypothetical protein